MNTKKMTTLHLRESISWSPLRLGFFLIPLALGCFALSPTVRAVCQQGCDLTNGNTFFGDDAFVNNPPGIRSTATGRHGLFSNTTADPDPATGRSGRTEH